MGGHHTPIFTLSREDVYDYQLCPKIVAFKAMQAIRNLNRPSPKPLIEPRFELGKEPQTIGRATELAVETAFSLRQIAKRDVAEIRIPQVHQLLQHKLAIEISPQRLTAHVKILAADMLKGAIILRETIEESYGNVRLLGRCESRNPVMPCKVQPDFVAFAEGTQKAILIESKGSLSKSSKRDRFQASYYNGIASKFGVMLINERTERQRHLIAPVVKFDQPAETLIVNPRRREIDKIQDSILIDQTLARRIWEAKQLGMNGKLPETDCQPTCPHNRYKQSAEEDRLEPATPLPLVFAQGYNELGYDLDSFYQRRLALRALPYEVSHRLIWGGELSENSRNRLLSWLTENLGLDPQIAADLVKGKSQTRPDAKKLTKAMSSEIEPWKKILKKRLKVSAPVVAGLATSLYSLPHDTSRFVRIGWKRWRK